ncbi:hypothetical protein [Schaalia odontolytica]|uniref:hypothetical protein n=1 Tax=Schaalia odontolytica TaxID=1660 RepID=UPI0028D62B36|nr:hypothetical protein [Schaalia odontolytica]
MGQQRGTYYWDDDSLSPGNRSDGGWSQNLFDDDGNLRGHARFVPDPESFDDGDCSYSPYDDPPMFMSSETRWESDDEYDTEASDDAADQLAEALIILIGAAAIAGVTYAAPRIKKWAEGTAFPFIKGTLSKVPLPWGKKQDKDPAPEGTDATSSPLATIGHGGAQATHTPLQIEAKRQKMSNAEAQARLMAAAAAQLFAEEQTRLVSRSDIVDAADVDELRAQIAMHPREKLETLLQHLARNPRLLEDGSLAQLASILDLNSIGLNANQQEHASLPRGRDADDGDSGSGE